MRGTLGSFLFSLCASSVAFAQLVPGDPNQPPPPPPSAPVEEPVAPAVPAPPPTAPAPAPAPAYPPGTQPAPAYPPPPPGYYYPPPAPTWTPPPAGPDKSARRHDGFYLRMGLGLAQGHVTTETEEEPAFKVTFDGLGPAYEIMLGGTVGSGVVIGGGIVAQDISDPDVEFDPDVGLADEVNTTGALGILVLGPFVDWFFDENGGFHAGALFGIGSIGLRDEDDNASTGVGGAIFAGYDFWVANQWSVGVEGRALFVSSERTYAETTYQDRARGFQLLFTALYH